MPKEIMEDNLDANTKPEQNGLAEIEKIKIELAYWKNAYYKDRADLENLRKNIEKDHGEAMKYRIEGFVNDLLNVLDGFQIALNNTNSKNNEIKNYLTGFQYIYNNLLKILKNEGVEQIIPNINDNFDEQTMEAIETVYREDNPNKIIKVNFNGYKLRDRLIRPAMVTVSTNIKPTKEDKKEIKK